SSDRVSLAAASLIGSPGMLDSNHAFLSGGLDRRDFFFSLDSNAAPVKQERTELSLSLRDSLNYPIVPGTLTGTVDALFEPRSIVRRSDIATSALSVANFSALSSLLVPNQVTALNISAAGRLDLVASKTLGFSGKMSYEERTENVNLLSKEISGVDPTLLSK